jgi:hypothetical protein
MDSMDVMQSVHRSLLTGLKNERFQFASPQQLIGLAVVMVQRKVARHWRKLKRFPAAGAAPSDANRATPLDEIAGTTCPPKRPPPTTCSSGSPNSTPRPRTRPPQARRAHLHRIHRPQGRDPPVRMRRSASATSSAADYAPDKLRRKPGSTRPRFAPSRPDQNGRLH